MELLKLRKKHEIDMTSGRLLPSLLRFAVPVILSGILQLAFNAADLIVVGRFAGDNALAAVGSNSALVSLIVNVMMGICTGTSVITARYFGSKDNDGLSATVHTSILIAFFGGFFLAIVGVLAAEPMLQLMGTPEEILPLSAVYLRIYFAGMPVMMLYNFSSAILRSVGDSKRPLYFLAMAGVINIGLNLFFVIVLKTSVAGVAIATVTSQLVSCFLTLRALVKAEGAPYRLVFKKLRFSGFVLKQILRIGIPAGIQNSLFLISNVIIQSSINSFGALVVAGNSAATSIEAFVFVSLDAVNQASIASVSQNFGAKAPSRVRRAVRYCLIIELVIGGIMGWSTYLLGETLLGIYTKDPMAISTGLLRFAILGTTFFLNGLQHMMGGVMRSIGYSILPMCVSLFGICGIRLIWIFAVYPANSVIEMLYISYPVSWLITFTIHLICYLALRKRAFRTEAAA